MTIYRITPVKHWSSSWAWWAARSRAWGGDTPTFKIAKADHYNMVSGERLCCWAQAADTDTWNDFDNVTIGATDLEFSNDDPFPAGLIYIAALPMYPFSRIQRKVNEWGRSALVGETTSTTNLILGNATARETVDNRTAPALPFYGFEISSGAGAKNTIVLVAYNHPSETPGAFMMEAAVDWIIGGSAEANAMLTYTNFFVYPCLNPQGVWSGYFRSCPQNATLDHNRKFNDGTSGVLECVDAIKAAIAADVADVDVTFDFHSYMDNNLRFGNCIDHTDADHVVYKNAMNVYDAGFTLATSAVTDGFKDWIDDTYSPVLAIAPEHGGALTAGVSDYLTYGENLMKALADFIADGNLPNGP